MTLLRFLLGGVLVSLFAALGGSLEPKTFAGLFGASPAIALTSLAIDYHERGGVHVKQLAQFMIGGAAALLAYSLLCAVLLGMRRMRVLASAILALGAWGLVALLVYAYAA